MLITVILKQKKRSSELHQSYVDSYENFIQALTASKIV